MPARRRVSDPGAALVAAARAAGHRIVPVPGASSALAALSAAGDVGCHGFSFVGFLDARGNDRARAIAAIARAPAAQIVFEAPHRIEALAGGSRRRRAADDDDGLSRVDQAVRDDRDDGGRRAAGVARCRRESPARRIRDRAARRRSDRRRRAVAGANDGVLAPLLAALPLKQAVALAAEISGLAAQHALRASARAQGRAARGRRAALASLPLTAWARPGASCFCAWMFLLAWFCMRCSWRRSFAVTVPSALSFASTAAMRPAACSSRFVSRR